LNQLQNLKKKNIFMTANFDCHIDETNMTENEKKLYQFFSEIKNNKPKKEFAKPNTFLFSIGQQNHMRKKMMK